MTNYADPGHRYRLDSRIATGGMGEVWRATDLTLNRPVAVKLLKAEYADDSSFRTRFETEARHAAALHHPNVAAVFDFGDNEQHRPYLVMELVDGKPLSGLLRPGRQMPADQATALLVQAADGLAAAHKVGIVHRDVKPANLMVTPERTVKITDFGIARAADGMALTQTGQVMGTPQYLSPEQAEGRSATAASDVYSLGCVLFECLAGRRPFVGETPVATALAHVRQPVPDLPENVPADLAGVVRRCLAKSPRDRFKDAGALAAALRNPSSVKAPPPTAVVPTPTPAAGTAVLSGLSPARGVAHEGEPPRRRRRMSPWLLLIPILLLLALIGLAFWQGLEGDEDPSANETTSGTPTLTRTTRTSEPTQDQIVLTADDCRGSLDDVSKRLGQMGLQVDPEALENDGTHPENDVQSCRPLGRVDEGDLITVSYWGPPAEPTETPTTETPTTETTPPTTTAPTTTEDNPGPGGGGGNGNGRRGDG